MSSVVILKPPSGWTPVTLTSVNGKKHVITSHGGKALMICKAEDQAVLLAAGFTVVIGDGGIPRGGTEHVPGAP